MENDMTEAELVEKVSRAICDEESAQMGEPPGCDDCDTGRYIPFTYACGLGDDVP